MAKSDTKKPGRLIDWIILVFVLVVMSLLVADLSDSVRGEVDRHGSTPHGPESVGSAQVFVTDHPPVAPSCSTNMAGEL